MAETAVARYNRLVEAEPLRAVEQAQWLSEAFLRERITFDGEPMRTFLRPHLVERRVFEALRASSRRFLELAARIARRAFDGDVHALCAFLGTPAAEAELIAIEYGEPDVVVSRLDAFVDAGAPRFIEVNSDAPAGFGYADRMARVFGELPLFRRFARDEAVAYRPSGAGLIAAVTRAFAAGGRSGRPGVAIVDWRDVKTRADQELVREGFAADGFECWLADPRECEGRGGRFWAAGRAADVVYRRAVLSELVERADEVRGFIGAYRARLVPFVNSFRCRLSEDKAFFALLTDEAFAPLMTPEERAFVASVIPWTRKLEERRTTRDGRSIDLIVHVLARREELVLKPAHGYGGQSVLVGDETEPSAWQAAVERHIGAGFVVQARQTIPEELFPVCAGGRLSFEARKLNVNPFYAGGFDVGAVARASRASVINVSAGGGSVPSFVVG